jgi:hypothetical protein
MEFFRQLLYLSRVALNPSMEFLFQPGGLLLRMFGFRPCSIALPLKFVPLRPTGRERLSARLDLPLQVFGAVLLSFQLLPQLFGVAAEIIPLLAEILGVLPLLVELPLQVAVVCFQFGLVRLERIDSYITLFNRLLVPQ